MPKRTTAILTSDEVQVATLVLDQVSGMLHLRISNRPDVSAPPGSTLLIENLPANGKVRLNVAAGLVRYSDAALESKRRATTVQTNP